MSDLHWRIISDRFFERRLGRLDQEPADPGVPCTEDGEFKVDPELRSAFVKIMRDTLMQHLPKKFVDNIYPESVKNE